MTDWSIFDGSGHPHGNKPGAKPPKPRLTDRDGRLIPKNHLADKAVKKFASAIDIEHLKIFIGGNDRYEFFLKDLCDPAKMRLSLAYVMRKHGITLGELQTVYLDGMRQMSMLNAANAAPDIMADVAEDAKSSLVVCSRCDGDGVVVFVDEKGGHEKKCPRCEGTGKTRQKGDDHARDIVFEAMKITGQRGPLVAIQNNNSFSGNGLDARMEGILKTTQAITVGGGGKTEEKLEDKYGVREVGDE